MAPKHPQSRGARRQPDGALRSRRNTLGACATPAELRVTTATRTRSECTRSKRRSAGARSFTRTREASLVPRSNAAEPSARPEPVARSVIVPVQPSEPSEPRGQVTSSDTRPLSETRAALPLTNAAGVEELPLPVAGEGSAPDPVKAPPAFASVPVNGGTSPPPSPAVVKRASIPVYDPPLARPTSRYW